MKGRLCAVGCLPWSACSATGRAEADPVALTEASRAASPVGPEATVRHGDARAAEQLLPLVYDDLRRRPPSGWPKRTGPTPRPDRGGQDTHRMADSPRKSRV